MDIEKLKQHPNFYYGTENGVILFGDAIEILPGLEQFDLIFADPPFNIKKPYKDNRIDYKEWCADWITQGFRILKDTGSFYLMTLTKHLEWKMPIMAESGVFINLISWRNVTASRCPKSFWLEYQPIMLYGKTENYKFNRYAETFDSGERRWGGYSTEHKGQLKDRWDDIPFVYAGSIKHPEAILLPGANKKACCCQMPMGLSNRAILFSTDKNDIVLDLFSHSGTTAVSCEKLNRRWIAIEDKEEYCKIIARRIDLERQQPRLGENF